MCLRLGIVKITFAIFVLTDIYTLGLGIIKASFASALDFCYICMFAKNTGKTDAEEVSLKGLNKKRQTL